MVYDFNGWRLICYLSLYFLAAIYLKIKRKKSFTFLLFLAIMWAYFGGVISYTQFPIHIVEGYGEQFMGGQNVWRDMNLIPFKTGVDKSAVLNILMTMPFGFGLPFLIRASLKKICIAGLLCGTALEAGQFITALYVGYTFRCVDINDIICNFLGTLIGYTLFLVFKSVFVKMRRKIGF